MWLKVCHLGWLMAFQSRFTYIHSSTDQPGVQFKNEIQPSICIWFFTRQNNYSVSYSQVDKLSFKFRSVEDRFFIKTKSLFCAEPGSGKNQWKVLKLFSLGNGSCGEFIVVSLCCSSLLTFFPCSGVGPSCAVWYFTTCCCVGPPQATGISGGIRASVVDICSTMVPHGLQGNLCSGAKSAFPLVLLSPRCPQGCFSQLGFCSPTPSQRPHQQLHSGQHLGMDPQYGCSVNILIKYWFLCDHFTKSEVFTHLNDFNSSLFPMACEDKLLVTKETKGFFTVYTVCCIE